MLFVFYCRSYQHMSWGGGRAKSNLTRHLLLGPKLVIQLLLDPTRGPLAVFQTLFQPRRPPYQLREARQTPPGLSLADSVHVEIGRSPNGREATVRPSSRSRPPAVLIRRRINLIIRAGIIIRVQNRICRDGGADLRSLPT